LFNIFLIKGDKVLKLILANKFTLSWGFLALKFDVGHITNNNSATTYYIFQLKHEVDAIKAKTIGRDSSFNFCVLSGQILF